MESAHAHRISQRNVGGAADGTSDASLLSVRAVLELSPGTSHVAGVSVRMVACRTANGASAVPGMNMVKREGRLLVSRRRPPSASARLRATVEPEAVAGAVTPLEDPLAVGEGDAWSVVVADVDGDAARRRGGR